MASNNSAMCKRGQGLSFLLCIPAPPLLGGDGGDTHWEKDHFSCICTSYTHTLSVSWSSLYYFLKGGMGKDARLNRFGVFFQRRRKEGQGTGKCWHLESGNSCEGLRAGTFVSDLREKPESTDHMEWLQGNVRAEGRPKWQPLIFLSWSFSNISL